MIEEIKNRFIETDVPIGPILLAIFLQSAGAIWWASGVSTKVEALERTVEKRSDNVTAQDERVTRLEEKLSAVATNVSDIKELLIRRPLPK